MSRQFVVVGAGYTGMAAVEALRNRGFDGRVLLIGEEPHYPYERPPLSKAYLRGASARAELFPRPDSWYDEHGVEALLGTRVQAVHAAERVVELHDGQRIVYDRLLLATGGRPRTLRGIAEDRVLYLRTLDDADRLRARLLTGSRLVVVGAGFIGCEVAATARSLGVEVTVLEALDRPLGRVFGDEIGTLVAEIHRDEGVDLRCGEAVTSVTERGGEAVVTTAGGTVIACDAVVVGVGIVPNVELVAGTGVEVDNGIVVDERCRTSVAGIYAAGDVANHEHPIFGRRMRVEHYDNALRQGAAAAASMLDRPVVFDDVHWFWSDQYAYNLQYVGCADGWDELVMRGRIPERRFTAFYLCQQTIVAAFGVNRGRDVAAAKRLIHARARVDPRLLRDEAVDLRALARRP
jgi:3-phenylpropionate/trans-cinnamate dioxygenase ferredoxin reductase component